MNITLFNKKYWVRRFEEQKEVKGYITSGYHDFVVSMNVHPTGSDGLDHKGAGARRTKHLEGHSSDLLVTADQSRNQKGDLLYYMGEWYECISAQLWDHTVLSHLNYQFSLVPNDASRSMDLVNPPTGDPRKWVKGE